MNYADLQRLHDEALLTTHECYQTGATHAAYGWSKRLQHNYTEKQKQAYIQGYNDYLKQIRN